MTTTAWDTSTHTDVVCPPAADAVCRHCGIALAEHDQLVDPDAPPVPDEAGCRDDAYLAWREDRPRRRFELADGENLDCAEVGTCPVCDSEICAEHSNEFVTCADSSAVLHHPDCRHHCDPCVDALREDARNGDRS